MSISMFTGKIGYLGTYLAKDYLPRTSKNRGYFNPRLGRDY